MVTFDLFGQRIGWVVECKSWNRRVPKEKVLALRELVADLGADRGILVSQKGFQPAATAAASTSPILLVTASELKRNAQEALYTRKIEAIDKRSLVLQDRLTELYESGGSLPGSITIKFPAGMDAQQWMRANGNLSILATGIRWARSGQFPAPVRFSETGDQLEVARDAEDFLKAASALLSEVERWLESQERDTP